MTGKGGHSLGSLKNHLGLHFEHHDAGEDARAAAEIVLKAESVACSKEEFIDVIDDEEHVPEAAPCKRSEPLNNVSTLEIPQATTNGEKVHKVIGRSTLTQGNLNNNHFYLREFIIEFPLEVIGGSNRASVAQKSLLLNWGGKEKVTTDIDGSKKIFRNRSWVREFFERTAACAGDLVENAETAPYCYQVSLVRA